MKLTEAQRRNLEHVRDYGKPMPRSKAGYNCRVANLSEFVWLLFDGSTATESEVRAMPRPIPEWKFCQKIIGERLTDLGRGALKGEEPAP